MLFVYVHSSALAGLVDQNDSAPLGCFRGIQAAGMIPSVGDLFLFCSLHGMVEWPASTSLAQVALHQSLAEVLLPFRAGLQPALQCWLAG